MRWPAACAIGVAVLAAASPALPDGEPIVLQWSAPPGCPSEREVRTEVERVLGGPPDPASRLFLSARAKVTRGGAQGFHVHLVTDLGGAIGERDLDGRTCAAVANATALIVALTFDPTALARKAAPAPAPAPLPAPPPPVPPRPVDEPTLPPPLPVALAPPPPSVPSPHARRPTFAAGLIGSASVGSLPGVGVGVGGLLGVLVGRFRADVAVSYWPDKTATLPSQPAVGGHFRLVAADASACYALLRVPLELAPCLGIEAGSMSAAGFGVPSPTSGSAPWIAPWAEALAALPLAEPVWVRLGLGVLVPTVRPPFFLASQGTVYTAGPVAGRATLGVEVRF